MNTPDNTAPIQTAPGRRDTLSAQVAQQMRSSVIRLAQLNSTKIVTKDSDAEKAALESFLRQQAYANISELLGCWFAVRNEYEPLIKAYATLLSRSTALLDMNDRQQAKPVDTGTPKAEPPCTDPNPTIPKQEAQ